MSSVTSIAYGKTIESNEIKHDCVKICIQGTRRDVLGVSYPTVE
jgi:hypothetical protein